MSVGHNVFDFTISTARLPFPIPLEQAARLKKGQSLVIDTVLQLVVPPRVVKGLIQALTIQIQAYENQFGKIPVEGETDAKR